MDNKIKRSFALLITIMLLVLFASLSISIIETKTISTNIDTLKYLNLQANIHLGYIKKYINAHTIEEIDNFDCNDLNDSRFKAICKKDEDDNKTYHIYINTVDGTHIRLYDSISK